MPTVVNRTTGQTYQVSDTDAIDYARQDPNIEVQGDVAVAPTVSQGGAAVAANPDEDVSTPGEQNAYYHGKYKEEQHDTLGSRARSFAGGGASMLSLGFANPWQDDQEFHPNYATGGKVAGALATSLIPGLGEVEAGEEAGMLGRGIQAAKDTGVGGAVGSAATWTPLGGALRLGHAAADLLPEGGGLLGGVGRAGVEGAVGGGAMGLGGELSHQLLDKDADFSGENLLDATLMGAAYGGGIGVGGSLVSEGVGAVRGLVGRLGGDAKALTNAEFAAKANANAPQPGVPGPGQNYGPPMADFMGPNASKSVSLFDGLNGRESNLVVGVKLFQELDGSPAVLARSGWTKSQVTDALAGIQREREGIAALRNVGDAPGIADAAHTNDINLSRLSETSTRVPPRWSDPQLREQALTARDAHLADVVKRFDQGYPVSRSEEDAGRYAAQLGVGKDPAVQQQIKQGLMARTARGLLNWVPGGRLIGTLGAGAGMVGLADLAVTHGVRALVHGAAHLALPIVAGGAGLLAVRALFRNPEVGGLVAANVSRVLNSTAVHAGNRQSTATDPRHSLRDLADRVRQVTPEAVNAATVASLQHVASQSPLAVQRAGAAAAQRHTMLRQLIDHLDPPATGVLGRPLPTATAARQAADVVRAASSPLNFLSMALHGRLTPTAMTAAERFWPATVAKARAEMTGQLSRPGTTDALPHTVRTQVETLMGPQPDGTRGQSYRSAIADSVKRTTVTPPRGSGPKEGAVKAAPPAPTPVDRAANPGQYR